METGRRGYRKNRTDITKCRRIHDDYISIRFFVLYLCSSDVFGRNKQTISHRLCVFNHQYDGGVCQHIIRICIVEFRCWNKRRQDGGVKTEGVLQIIHSGNSLPYIHNLVWWHVVVRFTVACSRCFNASVSGGSSLYDLSVIW